VRPSLIPENAKLAICLGAVYLIWGVSFLFSKVGVSHLPPFLFSGVRFMTAGTILLSLAHAVGEPWPSSRADWRVILNLALLLVFLSNGLSIWAVQYLPSNEMALLNTSVALWLAGLGTLGPRGHSLSPVTLIGIAIGTTGVVLILLPGGAANRGNTLAEIVVLMACFSFAIGTIYYRGVHTSTSAWVMSGAQMLMGGAMLTVLGLAHGDAAAWHWDPKGILALAYLTLCSSCLAYSAYAWLTRHATPTLTGSFGYVNPAIAAVLGWVVLDERLTPLQMLGMGAIIIGVLFQTLPRGKWSVYLS
jgi:drug/metabolite transporter (DMT)-like permease